jgi:hypothetical protein
MGTGDLTDEHRHNDQAQQPDRLAGLDSLKDRNAQIEASKAMTTGQDVPSQHTRYQADIAIELGSISWMPS